MAERRMFSKSIIDSDAFLDLPQSTQLLYFHLAMRANDDGFVNNPKRIARTVGSGSDDIKLLLAKQFIISFDSGVIVIRHWWRHNYIQKDRYKETAYKSEKSCLSKDESDTYNILDTQCIHDVYNLDTQVSIGKDSIGEYRIGECEGETVAVLPEAKDDRAHAENEKPKVKRFVKPTAEEIKAYCEQANISVDAERFFDYYEANGWKVGKNPMRDWKAAVRTWTRNGYGGNTKPNTAEKTQEKQARIEKIKNKVFKV